MNIRYTISLALILLALALTLTGCTSIGICERRAIAEEQRGFMAGQPIFRVHHWWYNEDTVFCNHAINYLLHPDGTRSYYDVAINEYVKAPDSKRIIYDSHETRVEGKKTFPPQTAPRL